VKLILAKIWKALHLPKNFQLFVMRLFQDQFLVGVTGVFLNDNKEVLLLKHTYRQTVWSLPGGYLKGGEHPSEGLERETKEESGLVVSVDNDIRTKTDRESARLELCYSGKFIGGNFTPSHEVAEYGLFSFEKLPEISRSQLLLIDKVLNNR